MRVCMGTDEKWKRLERSFCRFLTEVKCSEAYKKSLSTREERDGYGTYRNNYTYNKRIISELSANLDGTGKTQIDTSGTAL